MTIPLDASGLNFRAGPGAGRARAGLKMLRYRDGAEGVREGVGVPGRRGGRMRLLENARRWRGRIERRRHADSQHGVVWWLWRSRAWRCSMMTTVGGTGPHVDGPGPWVVEGRPLVAAGRPSGGATLPAATASTASAPTTRGAPTGRAGTGSTGPRRGSRGGRPAGSSCDKGRRWRSRGDVMLSSARRRSAWTSLKDERGFWRGMSCTMTWNC
jgi:hypothetical protein